jgi:uncharacterized protein (TIGR03435 family)
MNNYTIVATMPPETTKEQFQKMLQNLLVERFHLVFHHETRNFPGYELVVDKGGPKFKEVTPTQPTNPDAAPDPRAILSGPRGADGFPNSPGPRTIRARVLPKAFPSHASSTRQALLESTPLSWSITTQARPI